jgi:predicted O-methyltransferase YrrM
MAGILKTTQEKYLNSFITTKDPLLKNVEEFARENKVPILDPYSANLLEQIMVMLKPKRVLEIGTAVGYSSIRIARLLGRQTTFHTIEKSKDNILLAKENINKASLQNKIKIIEGDALRILPQLKKKYDLIFLDADKEDYKRLFDYSMLLLKKGGVVFIDNLLWHGYVASKNVPVKYKNSTKHIKEFNRIFMMQPSLHSIIIPVGDGVGIGVKII